MPVTLTASASADVQPAAASSYGYSLTLLTTIYVFNFIDRQIITILAEPIKAEFALQDWQVGSMTGLAFAILYTIAGFPIARMAERGDRARIISIAVICWSAFTAACGLATNFVTLLLARIGVGLGEAGCTPPAHSLLADIVPRDKRSSAFSIYMMGAPIGQLIGMVAGGFIAGQWGWRVAFFFAAAPGAALMLLAMFTLSEPRRAGTAVYHTGEDAPSFWATVRFLLGNRAFLLVAIGGAAAAFFYYGLNAFFPSFFLRNHAIALGEEAAAFGLQSTALLGLALGVGSGVAGVAGALLGGWLSDTWGKRDLAANVALPAIGAAIAVPLLITAMLVPSFWISVSLVALCAGLYAAWVGSFFAAAIGLVPPASRATASALVLFIINMVGIGFGPLCVGLISDGLSLSFGAAEGLRWAMVATASVGLVAGGLFWAARNPIRRDTVG